MIQTGSQSGATSRGNACWGGATMSRGNQSPSHPTRGWLWSLELQSWLAPDEALLHLHDAQGRLRLTEAVATQAARQEAEAARDQLETRLAALRDLLKAHNIDPNSL